MWKKITVLCSILLSLTYLAIISCKSTNSDCKNLDDITSTLDTCLSEPSMGYFKVNSEIPSVFYLEGACWQDKDQRILKITYGIPVTSDVSLTIMDRCSKVIDSTMVSLVAGIYKPTFDLSGYSDDNIFGIRLIAADFNTTVWYKDID